MILTKKAHNFVDISSQRFGRLTVVSRVENDKRGESRWLCQCVCGKQTIALGSHLRKGRIVSCGCYMRESAARRIKSVTTVGNLKHGETGTRLYRIWANMKTRCFNKSNKVYQWYGALGTTVCDEWLDYSVFAEWARANGYADNLTLERRNPFGNYEPANCEWIPLRDQNKNKRSHPTNDYNKR